MALRHMGKMPMLRQTDFSNTLLGKFEIRISKFETNSKHKTPMTETLAPPGGLFGAWEFRSFVLVSDFESRISCFGCRGIN